MERYTVVSTSLMNFFLRFFCDVLHKVHYRAARRWTYHMSGCDDSFWPKEIVPTTQLITKAPQTTPHASTNNTTTSHKQPHKQFDLNTQQCTDVHIAYHCFILLPSWTGVSDLSAGGRREAAVPSMNDKAIRRARDTRVLLVRKWRKKLPPSYGQPTWWDGGRHVATDTPNTRPPHDVVNRGDSQSQRHVPNERPAMLQFSHQARMLPTHLSLIHI